MKLRDIAIAAIGIAVLASGLAFSQPVPTPRADAFYVIDLGPGGPACAVATPYASGLTTPGCVQGPESSAPYACERLSRVTVGTVVRDRTVTHVICGGRI